MLKHSASTLADLIAQAITLFVQGREVWTEGEERE
jgi:hypothetical protein